MEDNTMTDTPGKIDHQQALVTADFYVSRATPILGEHPEVTAIYKRAAQLGRCYKHNRDQLKELRARVKELEAARSPKGEPDHERAHNAIRRLSALLEHFESEAENNADSEDLAEDLRWIVEDLDTYIAACRG